MLLDIHSHILYNVDDGAKDIDESFALLSSMALQGITDVIATPHFYPQNDTLEDFKDRVNTSFEELKEKTKDKKLPNIYLGCEILYYHGISKVDSLKDFTLNNSNYLLLEPNPYQIDNTFLKELIYLKEQIGIIPIIPHIERYYKMPGFKKLVKFVKENSILTQVNAASFLKRKYNRILKKLVKEDIISFIGTDAHSTQLRPPLMENALQEIEKTYGKSYKFKLISNSKELYSKIIVKDFTDYDI